MMEGYQRGTRLGKVSRHKVGARPSLSSYLLAYLLTYLLTYLLAYLLTNLLLPCRRET